MIESSNKILSRDFNEIFKISSKKYENYLSEFIPNFSTNIGYQLRLNQFNSLKEIFENHFEFDEINLIETGVSGNINYGLFGFLLGSLVSEFGGQMHSVDLDCKSCEKSKEIFSENFPNLKYKTYCMDSVEFLNTPPIIPNLVHLDSYDFQLYHPFPSTLHCWKEFISIEKLMPPKSIIIIDDNWFAGTHLQWIQNGNNELVEIKYPIIGKGTHVYHESFDLKSNWRFIETKQNRYENIKLVFIKK
jgi:hypothetical protein